MQPRTHGPSDPSVGKVGGGTLPADAVTNIQSPVPYRVTIPELIACIARTADLLVDGRIHLPPDHVGTRLRFADATSARVYRETMVVGATPADPCVLIVKFRLRIVRGRGHALFRWESLLNTPLFVGFLGFVSKLWLAHDQRGVYRGVYEWDGPARAEQYARSLWRVLAPVSAPHSIAYRVLPGLRRDDLLRAPDRIDATAPGSATAWWRLTEAR